MTSIKIAALGMLMTAAVGAGSGGCQKQAGASTPLGVANAGSGPTTLVFEDHTGDEWPVHEALNTWSKVIKASGAALVVEYGQCRAGARCVRVGAADHGEWNKVLGHTTFSLNGAEISLNTYYSNSVQQRRAIACHELGHALGLKHNPSRDSCLFATVDDAPAVTPDRADQDALARLWPAR